jgi:hypothetical protein
LICRAEAICYSFIYSNEPSAATPLPNKTHFSGQSINGAGHRAAASGSSHERPAGLGLAAHAAPGDIRSALFTTGLIVVAFEYIDREDADQRANLRLRRVLSEEAPAIRDAGIDGFAFAPDHLAQVASPETLDRIVRNTLAIQLGDQELADDLYTDLRQQVTRSAERRLDVRPGGRG